MDALSLVKVGGWRHSADALQALGRAAPYTTLPLTMAHEMLTRDDADPDWFIKLKPFTDFGRVVDRSVYTSAPQSCALCLTDIVGSTAAIAAGQYKAVMNALGGARFPFSFGGDGASLLVNAEHVPKTRDALAATGCWVREQLGLELRTAMVPVNEIRAAGHDVLVAPFAVSAHVSYAMFSGHGLDWAERQMKAGAYLIPAAPAGTQPDLAGLSCRWSPVESRQGLILSLIVRSVEEGDEAEFAAIVRQLLQLIAHGGEAQGHPASKTQIRFRWPPPGLELEAKAMRGRHSMMRRKLALLMSTFLAYIVFKSGRRVGRFDPARYRDAVSANSDFRKFDDGLRMTLDCRREVADNIESFLAVAHTNGKVRYGTHRQDAALITCIVPSIFADDHMHFLDGSAGGYALAAKQMKAMAS
jgi:hypothetical protein